MIRRYLPLAELGLYALAYQVAGVVQQVTVIMSTLLLPLFSVMIAEDAEDSLRRIVSRAIPYWLLGFSVFLGLLLAATDWVIRLFFGAAFAGAVPPLAVLMLATIALAIFSSLTPLLTAVGATWTITAVVVVSAGVNVGMNLVLIPRLGIIGAAVATALAYALAAGMILIAVRKRFGLAVARYALFMIPVSAVYLCRVKVQGVGFYPAAAVALGLAIWGLVRAFRLFDRSDLPLLDSATLPKWIRGVLRRLFTLGGEEPQ
jgi:O-antigen/teichoic acid export membrane protein